MIETHCPGPTLFPSQLENTALQEIERTFLRTRQMILWTYTYTIMPNKHPAKRISIGSVDPSFEGAGGDGEHIKPTV